MEKVKGDYKDIIESWNNGMYVNTVYQMIYSFIKRNKYELYKMSEIQDIFIRIKSIEPSRNIVFDFIYGEKYQNLRNLIEE